VQKAASGPLAGAGPLEPVLAWLVEDLEVLSGRRVKAEAASLERGSGRPSGIGQVGLCFRFSLDRLADSFVGLLVISWRDAAFLAGAFDLVPEADLPALRQASGPDAAVKRRLLKLGPYLAGSLEAGLAEIGFGGLLVRFETCQGLRADQGPSLGGAGPPWSCARFTLAFEGHEAGPASLLIEQAALA
jgi:hypothetical protein